MVQLFVWSFDFGYERWETIDEWFYRMSVRDSFLEGLDVIWPIATIEE